MTKIEQAKKFICVFCGAQNAVPKHHLEAGKQFGIEMAKRQLGLVYGGGDCGLMGAVANAVLESDGWVTGVFPAHLRSIEQEHKHLSETVIVDSMHARKQILSFLIMRDIGAILSHYLITSFKQALPLR